MGAQGQGNQAAEHGLAGFMVERRHAQGRAGGAAHEGAAQQRRLRHPAAVGLGQQLVPAEKAEGQGAVLVWKGLYSQMI